MSNLGEAAVGVGVVEQDAPGSVRPWTGRGLAFPLGLIAALSEGCGLDLEFPPPLIAVVEHVRATVAGVGLDEDRVFPSLGGRHKARHFLRFSGPGVGGIVLVDEYTQPTEVILDLRLEEPWSPPAARG